MTPLFEAITTIGKLEKQVAVLTKEAKQREAFLLRRIYKLEADMQKLTTGHQVLRSNIVQVQQQKSR